MRTQNGFLNILVAVVAVIIIGASSYFFVVTHNPGETPLESQTNERSEKQKTEDGQEPAQTEQSDEVTAPPTVQKEEPPKQKQQIGLFGQQCEGTKIFTLNTFPLDPKNIELIMPMGRVQDSHVTPTDHQYIIPVGTEGGSLVTNNPRKYEIKAPADGSIISIELFKEPIEEQYRSQAYADNYLVLFEHSCNFYTRLIHIDTLSEKILASFSYKNPESQHPYASTRIPVKEGEVIGTVGSHSFDFQIMDVTSKDKNIISPHNIDSFSVYTVDTFKYISSSLHAELLAKNLTKREPLGGKIGYDVPGKLIGNWFLVGRSSARENYWVNNLSIVYDHLDHSQIRVSLGNFNGYPKAFGVRGNAPDPATVGTDSGVIKYELVAFDYYSRGVKWDTIHHEGDLVAQNTAEPVGVALFQLTESEKLKVELFPGKTVSQVSGFTTAALLYER